jgi:hypothetical protein
MGRLGFPLLIAMALSPYFAGLAFQKSGADLLALVTAIASVNVLLIGLLRPMTRRLVRKILTIDTRCALSGAVTGIRVHACYPVTHWRSGVA